MLVVVLAQYAIGMVVNLFVTIPAHHPGAKPSNYFSGSGSSVAWAIADGPAALAVHAALGLALVVAAIAVAVLATNLRRRGVIALAWLGAACILGAGFNGASFLDFNHDISSLIMSLLAAAAIACYAVILYALPATGAS
jgi:heme/copper-type cytochrome/quinol oxidase subunit 3